MSEKFSGIQELATQSQAAVVTAFLALFRGCWFFLYPSWGHAGMQTMRLPWALSHEPSPKAPKHWNTGPHVTAWVTHKGTQLQCRHRYHYCLARNWKTGEWSRPAHCLYLKLRGSVPVDYHPAMWTWLSQERMNIPGFEVATVQVIGVWGCLLRISVSMSSFLQPDFSALWPKEGVGQFLFSRVRGWLAGIRRETGFWQEQDRRVHDSGFPWEQGGTS